MGKDNEKAKEFVKEDGRRKYIGEDEASCNRNAAEENERINIKFCESYEHFLALITCAMALCEEVG